MTVHVLQEESRVLGRTKRAPSLKHNCLLRKSILQDSQRGSFIQSSTGKGRKQRKSFTGLSLQSWAEIYPSNSLYL